MRCNCWHTSPIVFSQCAGATGAAGGAAAGGRKGDGRGREVQEANGDACHPAVKSASSVPSVRLSLHLFLSLTGF